MSYCLLPISLPLCIFFLSILLLTRRLVRTRFSIYRSQRSATSFSLNQLIVLTLFRCKNKIANNFPPFFSVSMRILHIGRTHTYTKKKLYEPNKKKQQLESPFVNKIDTEAISSFFFHSNICLFTIIAIIIIINLCALRMHTTFPFHARCTYSVQELIIIFFSFFQNKKIRKVFLFLSECVCLFCYSVLDFDVIALDLNIFRFLEFLWRFFFLLLLIKTKTDPLKTKPLFTCNEHSLLTICTLFRLYLC